MLSADRVPVRGGRAVDAGSETRRPGATPESGVNKLKGEAGLKGSCENKEGAVSVRALFSDVVLSELNGLRVRLKKSR